MDNVMDTEARAEPRPADELMVIAVKIPRGLVAVIDNAAGKNWDSRNRIVSEVIGQYFTGQLIRADDTPLDFSDSIDWSAPMVRREIPQVYQTERERQ